MDKRWHFEPRGCLGRKPVPLSGHPVFARNHRVRWRLVFVRGRLHPCGRGHVDDLRGAFFGATTILAGGATVATVAAAMVSGPTSFFMVNGTFIGMGLLFAFTAELKARSLAVLMDLFDPRVSGLTPLLQILAQDKVCDVFGAILGVEAKRLCKEWGSVAMENILKLTIAFSIFDLAVFMLKVSGINLPYTTRCEARFKSQLMPPAPNTSTTPVEQIVNRGILTRDTVIVPGFIKPGEETPQVRIDRSSFEQMQQNAKDPKYLENVERTLVACETDDHGFANQERCRESYTQTLIGTGGAALGGQAMTWFSYIPLYLSYVFHFNR